MYSYFGDIFVWTTYSIEKKKKIMFKKLFDLIFR